MAMIATIERFVRANGVLLAWASVVGWAAVGIGALRLYIVRGRHREDGAYRATAALALLFAVEMAHPLRYTLMGHLRSLARAVVGAEAVTGRRPFQAAVVLALLVASAGLLTALIARGRRTTAPGELALAGAGVGLLGFTLEITSLHAIDQYYQVYWMMWYLGIALAIAGIAWASLDTGRGAASATPHRAKGP